MQAVKGENYLCFYALMEMILRNAGYNDWNQYNLANQFGVVLPSGYEIEGIYNTSVGDSERLYGAHINCNDINKFFVDNKIHMNVSYVLANPYGEYSCEKKTSLDEYYIYTFSYGTLYKQPEYNKVGHAALVLKIYDEDRVKIYDPGPDDCGEKDIDLYYLHESMYDARGGIYIFKSI